jgi:hypothetical protein
MSPTPDTVRRVPGWAVVAVFLLLAGAIGGGVRYLLQTVPPGSQPAPSPAPSGASASTSTGTSTAVEAP